MIDYVAVNQFFLYIRLLVGQILLVLRTDCLGQPWHLSRQSCLRLLMLHLRVQLLVYALVVAHLELVHSFGLQNGLAAQVYVFHQVFVFKNAFDLGKQVLQVVSMAEKVPLVLK